VPAGPDPPRLQKVIAASGIASRRAAEEWIREGRVQVGGRTARLGDRADPETASVTVDGVPLPVRPGLVTYLVNKPAGVVSTSADPQGRPTVVDLVPPDPKVFPVGRLDADSEGLLLLTNDGELANLVTHPRYGITKTYNLMVEGRPDASTLRRLEEGVELDDGPAAVVSARLLGSSGRRSHLELTMGEGRKREVRRMLDAVGHRVLTLFRTAIGPIADNRLRRGEWRPLSPGEVRLLYETAHRSGLLHPRAP
jgi:23S rRNA pseudouridine2605 synthase